jgi:hypothetical protein
MGMIDGIYYPDATDLVDNLNGTLATMATSVANSQKVLQADSLTQLNGWTGSAYPPGMLASLTEVSGGLDRNALFMRSNNNFWFLVSGARLINLDNFQAEVRGFSSIYTMAGTSFYDASTGLTGIFIDTAANYTIIQDRSWTNLYLGSGTEAPTFGYLPAYKIVSGGAILRGSVVRTGKNWNNGENIVTLPAEACPNASMRFTLTGASYALANVTLQSDGHMTIYSMMNVKPKWFSLDGVFIPLG